MKATRCGQRLQCHMACMLLVFCHLEDLAVQFDRCHFFFFFLQERLRVSCLMVILVEDKDV